MGRGLRARGIEESGECGGEGYAKRATNIDQAGFRTWDSGKPARRKWPSTFEVYTKYGSGGDGRGDVEGALPVGRASHHRLMRPPETESSSRSSTTIRTRKSGKMP
jgi:hypothetical protein